MPLHIDGRAFPLIPKSVIGSRKGHHPIRWARYDMSNRPQKGPLEFRLANSTRASNTGNPSLGTSVIIAALPAIPVGPVTPGWIRTFPVAGRRLTLEIIGEKYSSPRR